MPGFSRESDQNQAGDDQKHRIPEWLRPPSLTAATPPEEKTQHHREAQGGGEQKPLGEGDPDVDHQIGHRDQGQEVKQIPNEYGDRLFRPRNATARSPITTAIESNVIGFIKPLGGIWL